MLPLYSEIFSLVIRADINESIDVELVLPLYIFNMLFVVIDYNMIQGCVQKFTNLQLESTFNRS